MDWLHQKLASTDNSLPARNLKLFQEQADFYIRAKLQLSLDEFLSPHASEYVQKLRRYYEYYNIMQYCIETQPLWSQNGFQFPLIPFPTPDTLNFTSIAKRAIYYSLNHSFTFSLTESGLYYRIAVVVDSNDDLVIPVRENRAAMTMFMVQQEMNTIFAWANSFLSNVK